MSTIMGTREPSGTTVSGERDGGSLLMSDNGMEEAETMAFEEGARETPA